MAHSWHQTQSLSRLLMRSRLTGCWGRFCSWFIGFPVYFRQISRSTITLTRVNQAPWIAATTHQALHAPTIFHFQFRHLFPPPYPAILASHAAYYFLAAEDQLQCLIITAVWEVILILCNYTFLPLKMDLFNSFVKKVKRKHMSRRREF